MELARGVSGSGFLGTLVRSSVKGPSKRPFRPRAGRPGGRPVRANLAESLTPPSRSWNRRCPCSQLEPFPERPHRASSHRQEGAETP